MTVKGSNHLFHGRRGVAVLALVASIPAAGVGGCQLAPGIGSQKTGLNVHRLSIATARPAKEIYKEVGPALAANGQVVAFWTATNLVSDDTNNSSDVFVQDRETGSIERVSVAANGVEARSPSQNAAVSPDGRFVAFESRASNLAPGDTNSSVDIFIKDRQSGAVERVSVGSDGGQANGGSYRPALSADARYVAFWSDASNLVPNDENGTYDNGGYDIFVKDRVTGALERVSVASDGSEGLADSQSPALSEDGRFVAFGSYSNNLVADDANGLPDIFVKDRQSGAVEQVSLAADGTQADGESFWNPALSHDGRYVAFWSEATNLVPGDTNGAADIFVKDRETGALERVSLGASGAEANGPSYNPSLSADGTHVAFWSEASNLVSGDTNGVPDVFIKDRQRGSLERLSLSANATQGNGASYNPTLSADGRLIAFWSDASNLTADDTNGKTDVFLVERPAATP
jgi:Tol biopolymer transport system component